MAEKQKRSQHKKTKPVDPSILKSHNLCKSIQKIKKEKIISGMFEELIHKTNIIYLDTEKLYGIVFIEHLNKLRTKAEDRKIKIHELELIIHQKDLEITTLKAIIKNQTLQKLRLQQRQKYLIQLQLRKIRKKNQDSQIFQRKYDKGCLKSKQRKQNISQFSSNLIIQNQDKMEHIEVQVQTQFFQFNKAIKYYNLWYSHLQSIHIEPSKQCIKKCFGEYEIVQKKASQTMDFFSNSLHSRLNYIQNIQQEAVNCLKQNKILKDINIQLQKQVNQLKDERQKRHNFIWQNELNELVGQIKNEWKTIEKNQNLGQQKKVQRPIVPQENPVQAKQAKAEQNLKKFEKFKAQFLSKTKRRE